MGQLIDTEHSIFKEFPTDFHTDWQWWIMATKRAGDSAASHEDDHYGDGQLCFFTSHGTTDRVSMPEGKSIAIHHGIA